jgi:molybdate transport system substrate-binding protein
MLINRRRVLGALPGLLIVAIAARAETATTDLVLNCDTALGPAMTEAAARFLRISRVRVHVFPTGPGLIMPQLERKVQCDLVCTQQTTMRAAIATGVVAADAPRGAWRNPLVIAARHGAGPNAATQRLSVSDATPGSDMDGPAIIGAAGLSPATMLGVIDTDEVAFLLARGHADAGLLHVTDIRALAGLDVLRTLPDDVAPPITYSVAISKNARRPNPGAFVEFLTSAEGNSTLAAQGLEIGA